MLDDKKVIQTNEEGKNINTTSAVRAFVISPWTWITPSIGAMGCKSIATIRGRSLSLQIMTNSLLTGVENLPWSMNPLERIDMDKLKVQKEKI